MVQSKVVVDPRSSAHQPDESLEAYVMGALSASESFQLEEHILWCRKCQIRLEETAAYVEAMRAALARTKSEAAP
jgi:anti-sigma factor RsiW